MTTFLTDFLLTLAGISVSMALVTVILLSVRSFMKKYFTATCRYFIWGLVILRLLVPVGGIYTPSIISLSGIPEKPSVSEEDFSYIPPETSSVNGVMAMPEVEIPIREDGAIEVPDIPVQSSPANEEEKSSLTSLSITVSQRFIYGVSIVWVVGAALFLVRYGVCYAVSCARIRRTSREACGRIREIFLSKCSEMNIRKIPLIVVSEAVDSPMLYGFFRPTVVMPCIDLEDEAAEFVIAHELTHYKRGDLYVKLASMVGNAIHWFDPAAYIASRMLSSEMELSCDEKVLRSFGDEERVSYGRVMLDIVKNCKKEALSLSTGFNPAVNAIKERLSNILDSKKKGKGISVICLTLVICILSGSFLGYEVSAIQLPVIYDNEGDVAEETEETTASDIVTTESDTHQAETEAEISSEDTTEAVPETTVAEETTARPETSAKTETGAITFITEVVAPIITETITEEAEPSEPHVHSYTVVKTAPTCSEHGYNVYSCSCGHIYKTLVNRTHAHSTKYVEKNVVADGEEITYNAEICINCGIEVGYKKSVWDGTTISYYISGPFVYSGDYNRDGELVIYGKGDMPEYGSIMSAFEGTSDAKVAPWWLLSSTYNSIVVDTGITRIGENSFAYACEYVTGVKVSKTCTSIGKGAFLGGSNIQTVYLPASLEYISADAFPDSTNVTVMFEGTEEEFSRIDMGNLSYASVIYNVSY